MYLFQTFKVEEEMHHKMKILNVIFALLVVIAVISCSSGGDGAKSGNERSDNEQLSVVATTRMITDAARVIGGDKVIVTGLMIGMCETLLYGYKAGLDLDTMLESVSKGAAACWMLDNLAPRMLKRDFSPGFYVEHYIKDLGIALEEARRMNISLPGLSLVNQLYIAAKAEGHGRKGTQALLLALEALSGVKRRVAKG